jgi:hypothetical protein
MARPRKEIDWNQFEQLCGLQCTQSEIASVLHVHPNTLSDRAIEYYEEEDFSTVYKKFSENGKCSLRRNQFVISKKNASMAIWLGKIWLGQKDPGIDEAKGEALESIKAAIREISGQRGAEAPERSPLENKQPVLDQERRGEETKITA